jgi:hypothetical protein
MNLICKLLLWSLLWCLVLTRVQAQEIETGTGLFCDTASQVLAFVSLTESGTSAKESVA